MKTRPTASCTPYPGRNAAQPPAQAASRSPDRTAHERALPNGDPGAIEYASWLRLLRHPSH
ncbi:MAG: hypothetical protein K5880_03060 [Hydrogenophaga sp.]|uniref:hypothetical protein n=1 Tax=Hydrogenophaga sp. TaxID=1904254 RepID=UPI0026184C05|nr:hypothetical protein [Hydrogenophaga sp.]MCV0437577.1 hypothetical protein [Hydrogenophaga sp.]